MEKGNRLSVLSMERHGHVTLIKIPLSLRMATLDYQDDDHHDEKKQKGITSKHHDLLSNSTHDPYFHAQYIEYKHLI